MAEETNPFAELLGRLAQVPMRAIKLPFQLVGEALGTPAARNQDLAGELQRQLGAQVTGQQTPFSGGRQIANALSLGLIPNNPSAQVNPAGLNADQQGRFGQLTPLQQRLLQARNPADFAGLIGDASLFEEREPIKKDPLEKVGQGVKLFDPNTGKQVFENPSETSPLQVQPGSVVIDPKTGRRIFSNPKETSPLSVSEGTTVINPKTGETIFDKPKDKKPVSLAAGAKLVDPVTGEEIAFNPKTLDPGKANAAIEKRAASLFKDELSLAKEARMTTEIDQKQGRRFRGAIATFGINDGANVDPKLMDEIRAIIPDIDSRKANPIRDIATMFSYMKILEPESVFREGEQAMVRKARALFGAQYELFQNLFTGEGLTDQQRAEMFQTMAGVFEGTFNGYELNLIDLRKHALRAQLRGHEISPLAVTDGLSDIRQAILGRAGVDPDQARFPAMDVEAERMVTELFVKKFGRTSGDIAEVTKFANSLGFRLNLDE